MNKYWQSAERTGKRDVAWLSSKGLEELTPKRETEETRCIGVRRQRLTLLLQCVRKSWNPCTYGDEHHKRRTVKNTQWASRCGVGYKQHWDRVEKQLLLGWNGVGDSGQRWWLRGKWTLKDFTSQHRYVEGMAMLWTCFGTSLHGRARGQDRQTGLRVESWKSHCCLSTAHWTYDEVVLNSCFVPVEVIILFWTDRCLKAAQTAEAQMGGWGISHGSTMCVLVAILFFATRCECCTSCFPNPRLAFPLLQVEWVMHSWTDRDWHLWLCCPGASCVRKAPQCEVGCDETKQSCWRTYEGRKRESGKSSICKRDWRWATMSKWSWGREKRGAYKGENHEQEHGLETFHLSSNNHDTSLSLGPKLLAMSGFPEILLNAKCEVEHVCLHQV